MIKLRWVWIKLRVKRGKRVFVSAYNQGNAKREEISNSLEISGKPFEKIQPRLKGRSSWRFKCKAKKVPN